jgi:hypothetical protein
VKDAAGNAWLNIDVILLRQHFPAELIDTLE